MITIRSFVSLVAVLSCGAVLLTVPTIAQDRTVELLQKLADAPGALQGSKSPSARSLST